jgi:hypothetical protein
VFGDDGDAAAPRDQRIEVALGPVGAFENGNVGVLSRTVPAGRVVAAVPYARANPRPPRRPRPPKPREPRTPPIVATLRKAMEWRRQLDAGEIASQAEIARREGITRARVTQVMALLRLAPVVQRRLLALQPSTSATRVCEPQLRPFTRMSRAQQMVAVADLAAEPL